jgi:hypothetical protein
MLAPIDRCYNGIAKGGEEGEKKGAKLMTELLNFPLATLPIDELVHRSRSKEECASLLEDDEEEGDEAAEDSAPAAPAAAW